MFGGQRWQVVILEELESMTPVRCGNATYFEQLPDILDITIVNLKENEVDNCKRSCLRYCWHSITNEFMKREDDLLRKHWGNG